MLKILICNTDEENVLFAVINYAKKQQGRPTFKYLPHVITYHTEKHHSNSYALSARKSLDIKCICNTLKILCLNTSTYIKHSFAFIQTFVFHCGIFNCFSFIYTRGYMTAQGHIWFDHKKNQEWHSCFCRPSGVSHHLKLNVHSCKWLILSHSTTTAKSSSYHSLSGQNCLLLVSF